MFLTRILTANRLEERPHGLQSIWLQGDHAAAGLQVAYAREENAAILVNCETGRHESVLPEKSDQFFLPSDIEDPP
jgi:hypothetical protein